MGFAHGRFRHDDGPYPAHVLLPAEVLCAGHRPDRYQRVIAAGFGRHWEWRPVQTARARQVSESGAIVPE